MDLPMIDIDALPRMETGVGLFGSLAGVGVQPSPSVFEVTVAIALSVYR